MGQGRSVFCSGFLLAKLEGSPLSFKHGGRIASFSPRGNSAEASRSRPALASA